MASADDLTCAELVELVTDYFEGTMGAAERSRFEDHLASCPGCLAYLGQMRTTIELTGLLREDDLAPEVQAGPGRGIPRLAGEITRVNRRPGEVARLAMRDPRP
jgi:anti-sigma factor RsiW